MKRIILFLLTNIAIIAFIISAFIGLSPVYVVIAAGLTGFISKSIGGKK